MSLPVNACYYYPFANVDLGVRTMLRQAMTNSMRYQSAYNQVEELAKSIVSEE